MSIATRLIQTPVGPYVVAARDDGLTRVAPSSSSSRPPARRAGPAAQAHVAAGARALRAYFAGDAQAFAGLTLAPLGTDFQRRVWTALREIPFGSTESYGALARRIGRPGAARAVGQANHRNPLCIVLPCHRVVAARGALGGYAGGLDRKRWLLRHEASAGRD